MTEHRESAVDRSVGTGEYGSADQLAAHWTSDPPARLVVRGEVDLATYRRFGRYLAEAAATRGRFIVDLCQVTFISSAGVGELFRNQDAIGAVLVTARSATSRALAVSGLNRRVSVVQVARDGADAPERDGGVEVDEVGKVA